MSEEGIKIKVPYDLGMRLTGWHSSMWDPIYSVSSCTIAGCLVKKSTFEAALLNMQRSLEHPAHAENREEIKEIVCAMKAVLGTAKIRPTIIHAMARYLWSAAWADVMEERGESLSGMEITACADETPEEAVEWAGELLGEFEKLNDMTIEEVVERERPSDIYDYGGMMAGNFWGYGIDSIGDYKTPWCESSQLWDLVK